MESKMVTTNPEEMIAKEVQATKTIKMNVPLSRLLCFDQEAPCLSTKLLLQNRSNFEKTGEPATVLYYEDDSWIDFSGEVVMVLRPAFLERRQVVEALVNNCKYIFDFPRMLQIEFSSGRQRSVAWIDVNGVCFFPKSFVDGNFSKKLSVMESEETEDEDIKIRIDVRVKDELNPVNLGKGKGKVAEVNNNNVCKKEPEDENGGCFLNSQNELSKRCRINSSELAMLKWPCANLVKEHEIHHVRVTNLFFSGIKTVHPGATITSIYQCTRTDARECARWELFQKTMEAAIAAHGVSNTIFAWYANSAKGVTKILKHGFQMPTKATISEKYGFGVRFSHAGFPHLSAQPSEVDEHGERHIILCRIILGNIGKVEVDSGKFTPSDPKVDTLVDDWHHPKRYIVRYANKNTHILPQYVVSYKLPNCLSGESAAMQLVRNPSDLNLFAKLERSLPSEKVCELKNLCSAYKAGNMEKSRFIEQLRTISDDEMLFSIKRETCG